MGPKEVKPAACEGPKAMKDRTREWPEIGETWQGPKEVEPAACEGQHVGWWPGAGWAGWAGWHTNKVQDNVGWAGAGWVAH